MYETLALLGAFAFAYSVIGSRLEKTPFGGPVFFLAFGFLAGPIGIGVLALDLEAEGMKTVAELTLALVLFTDAANSNLSVLGRSIRLPERLLLIGLPLTILLGFGAGRLLFPELGLLEVAILATMLAPTDAALGQAVVTNEAVPASVREGLNVESGLNDGICVPILFTFLAFATGEAAGESTGAIAVKLVVEEIGIGLVVGLGLALLGSVALHASAGRGWLHEPWTQIAVPTLALASFGLAQAAGGSGFIACFAGGMAFGARVRQHKEMLLSGAEASGHVLALVTWVAFGAAFVGHRMEAVTPAVVFYALLSLTLVRMLPVFLSVAGLGLRTDGKLFLGWFGPRGLASIVFAVIVAGESLPGSATLSAVVICTVVFSIVAHGLSANPLAAAYGRRAGPG